jgi:hypothetical protein
MFGSSRSLARRIFVLSCLLVTSAPVTGWAQTKDAFRFEADTVLANLLTQRPLSLGLPEGFDASKLLAPLADENLSEPILGWFTYGDPRSRSVAVALTRESPARLFVDLNRDQELTLDEQIEPAGSEPNVWLVELDAEFVSQDDSLVHQRQRIRVAHDPVTGDVKISSAGSMQGSVDFQGQQRLAKYLDRDANGCWFDSEDRLLVDLNGDGRLDPLVERLPCRGMKQIGGELFAISGDRQGRWLQIVEVRERGSILPALKMFDSDAIIISIDASLASDGGTCVRLDSLDTPVDVPIGIWHVADLKLTVKGDAGTYSFSFVSNNAKANPVVVEADAEVTLDLLGGLRITSSKSTIRLGTEATITTIMVTPVLRSESGMYLTQSRVGKLAPDGENRLFARSRSGGVPFHIGTTGFT